MTSKTTSKTSKSGTEKLIKEIRRQTQKVYSSEQKILIVMEGMRAELSIAELCRKYGISQPTYYKWSKEFVEAGKKRLSGDETREATSDEVNDLRKENTRLKESLADLVIRYDIVKKSLALLD
jgi:transposase